MYHRSHIADPWLCVPQEHNADPWLSVPQVSHRRPLAQCTTETQRRPLAQCATGTQRRPLAQCTTGLTTPTPDPGESTQPHRVHGQQPLTTGRRYPGRAFRVQQHVIYPCCPSERCTTLLHSIFRHRHAISDLFIGPKDEYVCAFGQERRRNTTM